MKKTCGLLVALLLLPAAYAERKADRALEEVIQQFGRSLQYQTSNTDWSVLRNSPEEGFSAGTVSSTGPGLLVSCVPDEFYGAFLVWPTSDSLGTDYDDGDNQPVTLNWRNPNLTQSQQWLHLSPSGEDLDQVLIVNQLDGRPVRPQETDNFLDRLTRHAELNAAVTVSSSGNTKQATFSLDGAPSAETVKACGQERTSSETTLYFPDYVDGAGWSVQLVLSNIGIADEDATVDVYDSDGKRVRDLFDSEGTIEIPSLGSRVLRSAGAGAVRRGWIEVEIGSASISGLLTYRHAQSGIEVGVKPVTLGSHFALFVEESSDIGTGLAIFKPDSSPRIELRIRDEAGKDPLRVMFVSWRNFHQRARTIPEWFDVEGVDTEFLRDFRGLLFLRTEDGSPFAPLGLRFGKRTGSLSAVPVIKVSDGGGEGGSGGETATREEFESSTPSGYTAVTLNDNGRIWGVPTRYTNDSDAGTMAYMLLGKLKGCEFVNAEADRQSTAYIKTQSLGRLDNFESETVCRRTSNEWLPSWPGLRMTHLLFFDESSPSNTQEAVYDSATGTIEIRDGVDRNQVEFSEGESATRGIWENTPPGINVGDPVSAVGGDSLTYTISGTDSESFVILPETGQIRTRDSVVYDYEVKNRYTVTVGVEDDGGNSDTIDVTIQIGDLVPSCGPPSSFRVNHSDGRLTLRWSPLSDLIGHARVLGYETEIRRGTSGVWGDGRTFLGRNITGMIYADLTNGIGYQVRVRPINAEGDCGWSTPVSGIPTADYAPKDPEGPLDRFGPQPVGTPERNFRFLTRERCRHTSNGQTLDANCEYEDTGPDTGRIFLEFDDPSQGSCEITLAFSSLTAGSFIDECFDAGVNTNVPFDRSFRMPRSAPRTEEDLDPPPIETDPQRAPRNQEEFNALIYGRDDFIPGLCFGNCLLGDPPEQGVARRLMIDANGDVGEYYGDYTYENTGPTQGVLTFKQRAADTWVFTLDFEPSGNVRVTTTDPNGNAVAWPGSLHADLTLGAQPILLPIPPSWSAAIAIETDAAPEDWEDWYRERFSSSWERTLFGDSYERLFSGDSEGLTYLNTQGYEKLGRNRAVITINFDYTSSSGEDSDLYESLDDFQRGIFGSTWVFDLTFTSDGAAKFTLTITKEGFLPTVIEGFFDFAGDSINVDEFPEELLLPDDPPQASGEDRSGLEVAAAIGTRRIGEDDVQTFLVNNPGLQTAAYSPGDWLEPKDGSNQRMMIVGAGQVSAARRGEPSPAAPVQFHPQILKSQATVSAHSSPNFAEAVALLGRRAGSPVYSNSNSAITRLSVVCMQIDHDIPTRGARYFSVPKTAQNDVQGCQRNCVLEETENIQLCVWKCEAGSEGR